MTPGQPDDPTDELLFRFIAETCSASERAEVESWSRHDAANARRVEDIRRIWLASRPIPSRDLDRLWTRLRDATAQEPEAVGRPAERQRAVERAARAAGLGRLTTGTFPPGAWAAGLVVLAGGAALFVSLSHSKPPNRAEPSVHTYATGPAQTANIRLRDGSTVTLAPKSRLRVPDDFGERERLVTLDGEGFFAVVHNPQIPFRVRAKSAITEDIGTRFDLSAYDDEVGVVVIVAEGAVTLGHATAGGAPGGAEGAIVRHGERARIGGPDSTTIVDRVPLSVTDWTGGRLAFVKTPLAEIARTIGRWYDLDVRVADAAMQKRLITADFNTQSPKEMVEALAAATGGAVDQQGRVLTIRMKP